MTNPLKLFHGFRKAWPLGHRVFRKIFADPVWDETRNVSSECMVESKLFAGFGHLSRRRNNSTFIYRVALNEM